MAPHDPDEVPGIAEHDRLDWMRAEFRAAQQRRYEKAGIALVNRALASKSKGPAPEAEPPPRATHHTR
jgi:hypothetical protein